MRRILLAVITAVFASLLFTGTAVAGSPHFVGQTSIERDGDDLVVSGKIAGLGNETEVHVEVTALAECINPGGNKPQADNKESFSAEGDFPVQNGKALFELTLDPSFQPECDPPMTVEFSNVEVVDLTHGLQLYP